MLNISMLQSFIISLFCGLVIEYHPSQCYMLYKTYLLGPLGRENKYRHTDDVYNHLIDITNFTFLENPPPCNKSLLLLVIISSKWSHLTRRKNIRNTWKSPWEWTRVLFLVGLPNTGETGNFQTVRDESTRFGDIVMGNFKDAYYNMTYKHTMGLKWVAHHCPLAKYVLKLDDDVEVYPSVLREFLVQRLSPWGARRLIACNCIVDKYVESRYNKFVKEYCSTWCRGWVILYSQDAVQELLKVVQKLPFYWVDDYHITLTGADILEIPRIPLPYLDTTWRQLFKPETLNGTTQPQFRNEYLMFRLLH